MILFRNDYNYQQAEVHMETKNSSFVKMAILLRNKGIQNHLFHLAITQPDLRNIDPHNLKDPSPELASRIAYECKINPWYYFREVCRIPVPGSTAIPFDLHRGNLALIWTFYNNINSFLVLPRQHGKTMSTQGIVSNIMYFRGMNYTIAMLTKDHDLVVENCSRLREIRNNLPPYLISTCSADTDNKEGISYGALKTKYITLLNQQDPYAADRVARGLTTPFLHWDEIAYFKNIHITYPQALSITDTAIIHARNAGMPHANILTTTAGKLDSPEGNYVYNEIVAKTMPFNERLYDCANFDELSKIVRANSKNYMLYIVFSYLQLGKTQEWFQDILNRADSDKHKTDRDYLNIWTSGVEDALLSQDLITKIKASEREPSFVELLDDYAIRWYVADIVLNSSEFRKKPLVAGLDTSENVGRDFTSMVILDPSDMSIVGTMRCNQSNLVNFAQTIAKLMIRFENLTLVPERKMTAIVMIDMIILELQKAKINPFRRIFNKVIEHIHDTYADFNYIDPLAVETMRKHFGFITAGSGAQARSVLYNTTLRKAVNMNANRIYDETLIRELVQLKTKNGRLDHATSGHDDHVVAYLLACYLVYFGQNLSYYGIKEDHLLSRVSSTGETIDPQKKERQKQIRDRIYELEQAINRAPSHTIRLGYTREWNHLRSLLDESSEPEVIAKDQLVQEKRQVQNAPLSLEQIQRIMAVAF